MKKTLGVIFLYFVISVSAHAELLVFIHGYMDEGQDWRITGIGEILKNQGWQDAGHVVATYAGDVQFGDSRNLSPRKFVSITLPYEMPIEVQSRVLIRYIDGLLQIYGHQDIILVGHSAGGIVARLMMVRHPDYPVSTLITIASPHLGTKRAAQALDIASSPISLFAPFMGMDTLNRSEALYADLVPMRPGSLLFWLNQQRHPKARYISLVRDTGYGYSTDYWVPSFSQDMKNVAAIAHQAETIFAPGYHALAPTDGLILAGILAVKPIKY